MVVRVRRVGFGRRSVGERRARRVDRVRGSIVVVCCGVDQVKVKLGFTLMERGSRKLAFLPLSEVTRAK